MSFTVFLGNLPTWVTADDIKGWLTAENLVADAIKVIRNPETQESKGFAFIEAPNQEEMNAIIRRFDRAPLEDRLLRANPAQPPKPRSQTRPGGPGGSGGPSGPGGSAGAGGAAPSGAPGSGGVHTHAEQRPPRRGNSSAYKKTSAKRSIAGGGSQSAFAEELAKAL